MADNAVVNVGTGTTVAADEVVDGTLGTVKVQYVKIMDGVLDGTSKAAVGANGLAADVKALPNTAAAADGAANPTAAIVAAFQELFNGTTWDRYRNNVEVSGVAVGTGGTADIFSAVQTNYNAKGVVVTLVTTTLAAPGISLQIQGREAGGTNSFYFLNPSATNITTVGTFAWVVYPGITTVGTANTNNNIQLAISSVLPRSWRVKVAHNAVAQTYSVSYCYIL